jgi:PAS domain-containing protein
MLLKTSEQVRTCLERAYDAKRQADGAFHPALKTDFLEMEKRWLALARSYEFSERLTDFTAANSAWRTTFNELRARVNDRPDDTPRLQSILKEANVDALFERMWLASIVECSDDAIISKNLYGIITSWNKGAELIFGYSAEEAIGKPVTMPIPPDRQHEEDVILDHIRRGARI